VTVAGSFGVVGAKRRSTLRVRGNSKQEGQRKHNRTGPSGTFETLSLFSYRNPSVGTVEVHPKMLRSEH